MFFLFSRLEPLLLLLLREFLREFLPGVTSNSLYVSFSPYKATSLTDISDFKYINTFPVQGSVLVVV